MKTVLITGAGGFLGREIAHQAVSRGMEVHGLLLPQESCDHLDPEVVCHRGDVTKPDTLRAFLGQAKGAGVIHCAGRITIADQPDPLLDGVNVQGTANLLAAAEQSGAAKVVYVSSVHAIPELPHGETITETSHFDPSAVHGQYAKSKCAASALVMAAAAKGLPVSMVHPSGIIGPGDWGIGHITTMMMLAISRKLPAVPDGGYDFVDVRDVASGTLAALEQGQCGRNYLLTGHCVSIAHLMELLHQADSSIPVPRRIPMAIARMAAPFMAWISRLHHQKPLFTSYSLYTLLSNSAFSWKRAADELGYAPRPLEETVEDVVTWVHSLQTKGR